MRPWCVLLLVLVATSTAQAKRNKKGCKYSKAGSGEWSACVDGQKTKSAALKKGGDECEPTKTITRKCKECKYMKNAAEDKAPCDEATQTRTMTLVLKDDSPATCAPTKVVERKCGEEKRKAKQEKKERKAEKKERKDAKKARKSEKQASKDNGCKYTKPEWSACDPTTKKMTRTLTLRKGDPIECQESRVMERRCKSDGGSR